MSGDEDYLNTIIAFLHSFHSPLFVTKPISSLLFDGYEEDILINAQSIGVEVPYDKFGWFYPASINTYLHYVVFISFIVHFLITKL